VIILKSNIIFMNDKGDIVDKDIATNFMETIIYDNNDIDITTGTIS